MKTLFLDLDGTLIDPYEGITSAVQYAMREMGAEVPPASELRWVIGPPLQNSFPLLLGEGADIEEALALYREYYVDKSMYDADLYDGVGEMFEALHRLDLELYIATSKPHSYAQTIIDEFGISAHVDGLFGSELDGTNADKAALLGHALEITGCEAGEALMLGDREFDVLGAKYNHMRSIGALWGYAEEGELHRAEADALAATPQEVPELVIEMLELE